MLFQKYQIRQIEFKNRLIMLLTVTNFGTTDGFVTKKISAIIKSDQKGRQLLFVKHLTHALWENVSLTN